MKTLKSNDEMGYKKTFNLFKHEYLYFYLSAGCVYFSSKYHHNLAWIGSLKCFYGMYLKTRALVRPKPSTSDSVSSMLSALIRGTSCFRSQATDGVPIT